MTAPGAPTNVSAAVDGTSITVSWAGGANATSFRVELTAPSESVSDSNGDRSDLH